MLKDTELHPSLFVLNVRFIFQIISENGLVQVAEQRHYSTITFSPNCITEVRLLWEYLISSSCQYVSFICVRMSPCPVLSVVALFGQEVLLAILMSVSFVLSDYDPHLYLVIPGPSVWIIVKSLHLFLI